MDGAGPLLLKGVVETDDRLQRRHAQLVAKVAGRRAPPYDYRPTAPAAAARRRRVGRWVESGGPRRVAPGRIVTEGAAAQDGLPAARPTTKSSRTTLAGASARRRPR